MPDHRSPWWRRVLWPDRVLRLEAGTRAAFLGRPGSGKTTLQRWLLQEAPSALVFDTKLDPREWSADRSYQQVHHPGRLREHARAVLRVPVEWLKDPAGWKDPRAPGHNWTLALQEPMRRGGTVVLFDEALYALPSSAGHDGAHRLFQQGRSFGVTVLVGSQLANNLDTRVLRTAEHLFCFRTIHDTDLQEVRLARGVETRTMQVLRRREFCYHHESDHEWTVFRPINPRRRGYVRRRVHVPPLEVAAAGPRARAGWYVGRWLRRAMLPAGLWLSSLLALPVASWRAAFPLAGGGLYVLLRRWRADRWRVVVECEAPRPTEAIEPAPLELPAHEEPWRLRIPGRNGAAKRVG